MKTKFCIPLLLLALFALSANASFIIPLDTIVLKPYHRESVKGRIINAPLVFKTSPTAMLWGGVFPYTAEYKFAVEVTTGKKQSDQFSISILGKSLLLYLVENANGYQSHDRYRVSGWRVQYVHKFFIIKRKRYAPSGFYIAPMLSYADVHVSKGLQRHYQHTYLEIINSDVNIIFGIQAAHRRRLTFEVYGGGGYKSLDFLYHATSFKIGPIDKTSMDSFYKSHINVVFGINLGWAL